MTKRSMQRKIITSLVWKLHPSLRDKIRSLVRFNFHNRRYPQYQLFIIFIDGTSFHGGLTDRLKGIISAFLYCLLNNIEFRIYHKYPFELSEFLNESNYHWQLNNSDKVSYNIHESKLLYLIGDPSPNRLNRLKTKKQIHCYANRDIMTKLQVNNSSKYEWGELFKMLFKPSAELKLEIEKCQKKIGGKYISVTFRFQNLLGDFTEYDDVQELSQNEKEILVQKCITSINKLLQTEVTNHQKMLITSDSIYFLHKLTAIQNIYTFPSKVVHIDNAQGESFQTYLKSFLDLYLLASSEAIYSIGTIQMYKTEFPLYASKINQIPFQRILIE